MAFINVCGVIQYFELNGISAPFGTILYRDVFLTIRTIFGMSTPDDTISLAILVAFLSGISLIIFCNTPCGTSAGFFPSVENFSHDGAWP